MTYLGQKINISALFLFKFLEFRKIACAFLITVTFSLEASAKTLSLKEIREAGVVIQKWDTSCGAAALATVLTYTYNDPVSEREVATGLLKQTKPLKVKHQGGFSLLDMKRYVAERGYEAYGFRNMNFEDLRYLNDPIVLVQFHDYNHYVVFKGTNSENEVHLADPAFGNRYVTFEEFQHAWIDGMTFVISRPY